MGLDDRVGFKFCGSCGALKPNNKKHFHSGFGKLRHVCLECPSGSAEVFCFMCGKIKNHKGRVCISCQRNKYINGFYLSKRLPVQVIETIRSYIKSAVDRVGPTSKMCSMCGFILPVDEYYFQRQVSLKDGFKGVCKKCKAGRFRDKITPRTKKEWLSHKQKRRRQSVSYKYWSRQLFADDTQKGKDGKLQAKCKYCGRWFYPILGQVESRSRVVWGEFPGEANLYCSSGCKRACPTFGQHWSEKEYKAGTSRESNTLLRQLVLARDNHQCTKCGAKGKRVELHCHHVMPATQNPILANDPDNCATLCRACHVEVHQTKGCGYYDLRCGA